ncbi:MAG: RNase adapter RapZ, partial [Peptococcaceae bacterium]|nr:RNase adapter RapZ [Peptococcaceae bacterium]
MSTSLPADEKRFVIVTGLSGAGKSLACDFFEDMGYFCVDNLPVPLIARLADLAVQAENNIHKICLVIDMRGRQFIQSIDEQLNTLRQMGIEYTILYLDTSDEVLVNRFKETRRQHPLSEDGSIVGGIEKEREALAHVREISTFIMDTSEYSKADLKNALFKIWGSEKENMQINIQSFGFKFGIPIDADIVMDVRFLKNPFYDPALRPLTGRDQAVRDYVFASEEAKHFLNSYCNLIREV